MPSVSDPLTLVTNRATAPADGDGIYVARGNALNLNVSVRMTSGTRVLELVGWNPTTTRAESLGQISADVARETVVEPFAVGDGPYTHFGVIDYSGAGTVHSVRIHMGVGGRS